ncbi:MAG: hypothetical protein MJ054_02475 [Clostridia bacterium]|nr:hypothetical protein [Clostridia bacterium]
MESTTVIVRAKADALVKVYDETSNEVIYIDNTNDQGETSPISLSHRGGHYFIDVTIFDEN